MQISKNRSLRSAGPSAESRRVVRDAQRELIGEITRIDAGGRTLDVRENARPWRELRFSLGATRVRSGSWIRTLADLAAGQRVRVRYGVHGAERWAQRVELLDTEAPRLPPST